MTYPNCRGTEEERFWRKVQVNYETGCWEWAAGLRNKRNGGEYGCFTLTVNPENTKRPRIIGAHVWSYIYFNGPIPEGCEVHHRCENTKCVNPNHLESLTVQVHYAISDGACARNASKLYCKLGHMIVGANIAWTKHVNGRVYRLCLACRRLYKRERSRMDRLNRKQ